MGGIVFIAEPHPWIPAFAGMTELCKGSPRGEEAKPLPSNLNPYDEERQDLWEGLLFDRRGPGAARGWLC